MKIERIEVKNYRTLENVTVNFDGYYSAISGQNNAGKTALIRVLSNTFKDNSREIFHFRDDDDQISYREDRTQWVSVNLPRFDAHFLIGTIVPKESEYVDPKKTNL